MKKLLTLLMIIIANIAHAQQDVTFVGYTRANIRAHIAVSQNMYLDQSGVSSQYDRYDEFSFRKSDMFIICYYNDKDVCKVYKQSMKNFRGFGVIKRDIEERYIKINDTTFVNKPKTLKIKFTSDEGYYVIEYSMYKQ